MSEAFPSWKHKRTKINDDKTKPLPLKVTFIAAWKAFPNCIPIIWQLRTLLRQGNHHFVNVTLLRRRCLTCHHYQQGRTMPSKRGKSLHQKVTLKYKARIEEAHHQTADIPCAESASLCCLLVLFLSVHSFSFIQFLHFHSLETTRTTFPQEVSAQAAPKVAIVVHWSHWAGLIRCPSGAQWLQCT